MFGFLAPRTTDRRWRRSYARICQFQHRLFGITSLPFLSYEATFLYQLGIDFGLNPQLSGTSPTCCRLRRIRDPCRQPDQQAAAFAAAFGLLLAGVKLQDDVADSGRWFNRLLWWKYRRKVHRARRMLNDFDTSILGRVDDAIARHAVMEARRKPVALHDYVLPTADGFAAVFETFARLCGERADLDLQFRQIGRHVGGAVIAWDCAVDFDHDRMLGHFNPLQNQRDVRNGFADCLLNLAQIGWMLPEDSVSRSIIAGVMERVRRRSRLKPARKPIRIMERWGLMRDRRFAYARCDGCEAVCAVGECCGAGAEGASCCAEGAGGSEVCCASAPCCADCVCCECFLCGDSSRKSRNSAETTEASGTQPSVYEKHVGQDAVTHSELNPAGFVVIADERIPARTFDGNHLNHGVPVRITEADAFGVVVRSKPSESSQHD